MRSFRRKFGLVIPATNTSMEHELWSIIGANQRPGGLQGVGLHTASVVTPRPQLKTADGDIDAVIFWYALRENGFEGPLAGGGRLLREH